MSCQPRRALRNILAACLVLGAVTACSSAAPLPTVTPEPTPTIEPTATVEPTATPEPTPTPEPDITVCATGCDFTTIQTAIDDVGTDDGDIIGVAEAVHTEEGIMVDKSVTIQGQGAGSTIVQAHAEADSATDRVLFITTGVTVTVRSMTIRHGNPTDETSDGGGIMNQGTLTLERCSLSDNHASAGGGIYNYGALTLISSTVTGNTAGPAVDSLVECATGGGIKSLTGTMTLINTTVSGNSCLGKGGGIFVACQSTLELINSTVSGNDAARGNGGGLWIKGSAVFINSTISNNNASGTGGGVYLKGSRETGLIRGWLDFENTIIANNTDGREYCCDDCMLGDESTIGTNSNNLVEDGSCSPDYSGDPQLGPLAHNGGDTLTHALLPGSPAIDAIPLGSCTLATDQRGEPRPIPRASTDTPCDIGAFELQTDEG